MPGGEACSGCAGSTDADEEVDASAGSWRFVGDRHGGYKQVQTYSYVGDAKGNYELEERAVPTSWRVKPIWWIVIAAGCVAVAVMLWPVLKVDDSEGLEELPMALRPPSATACRKPAKEVTGCMQDLCCRYHKQLCRQAAAPVDAYTAARAASTFAAASVRGPRTPAPAPAAAPTVTKTLLPARPLDPRQAVRPLGPEVLIAELEDCDHGYEDWRRNWDVPKQVVCCAMHGKACPTDGEPQAAAAGPQPPFDCAATEAQSVTDWSLDRQQWCCKHEGLGCHPASTYFDCDAGFVNWQSVWSVEKSSWCCSHEGRACTSPAVSNG